MVSKKLLFGILTIVILTGISVGVYFALKHSTKTPVRNVNINFELKKTIVESPFDKKVSTILTNIQIEKLNISNFIGNIIQQTKLPIPYDTKYFYWDSISINDKDVKIVDGIIPNIKVEDVLDRIPDNINMISTFHHTCSKSDLDEMQKKCDPCKAELALCGYDGPVCKENSYCPDASLLVKCCAESKDGIFPTCDAKTFAISCGKCPGTKDCTPDCKGTGAKCTGLGWVCEEGVSCPSDNDLLNCCDNNKQYPTCDNGKITCNDCNGDVPSCPESCQGSGVTCVDQKYQCKDYVKKPSEDIMNKCCMNPKFPHPIWNEEEKKVQCANCDSFDKPDPKLCPLSCDASSYTCSAKGWECTPHSKCPTPEELINLKCCAPGLEVSCDNGFVKCSCPDGKEVCGDDKKGICCDTSTQCNKNSLGEYFCCSKEQICNDKCCPAETICVNDNCVAKCGVDPFSGKPVTCNVDEECVIINNLTSQQENSLKKSNRNARIDTETNTAYLCVKQNSKCNFNDERVYLPAGIQNYYPCYSFPYNASNEMAYCSPKEEMKDEKYIQDCLASINSKSNCLKNNCEWIDVLDYLSSGTSSDLNNRANRIQNDVGNMQKNWNGNYCYTDKTDYQRIVAFTGEEICTWEDCVSQIAQPGITDIVFNENTKTCLALQSCNNITNTKTKILNDNGTYSDNSNTTPIFSKNSNTSFPYCSKDVKCNIGKGYSCNLQTGRIDYEPKWQATNPNTPQIECVEYSNPSPDFDGYDTKQDCYYHNCEDDKCCLSGWTWDDKKLKCLLSSNQKCPKVCSGNHCKTSHDGCGPGWVASASGKCGASTCHRHCTGGQTTSDLDSDPTKVQISNDISYCYCDGKDWQNFSSGKYEFTVGSNHSGCHILKDICSTSDGKLCTGI